MKNLTPHAINIVINGVEVVINSDVCEQVPAARVAVTNTVFEHRNINGIEVPVSTSLYGEVENLGNPSDYPEGVIVSGLVLGRLGQEWQGIAFAPDGTKMIRDTEGKILGVGGLITVSA